MSRTHLTALAVSLFVVVAIVPGTASATPKYNPFTYTYDTLGEGEVEMEQYVDVVPIKGQDLNFVPRWYTALQFQTEFEYGITDRWELGLYVTYAPKDTEISNPGVLTEGTGTKQRLRVRLAEPGEWPVDIALYGELTESEREFEIEAKIILQKRIGRLRALVNLWAEREYYYVNQRDWVINPTAAVSYQVTPSIFPGIEAWSRTEWPDPAPHPRVFNLGPEVYVGPTMSLNFGRFWWTTGIYMRMNDPLRSFNADSGDVYGNFWFRTIVGVEL